MRVNIKLGLETINKETKIPVSYSPLTHLDNLDLFETTRPFLETLSNVHEREHPVSVIDNFGRPLSGLS